MNTGYGHSIFILWFWFHDTQSEIPFWSIISLCMDAPFVVVVVVVVVAVAQERLARFIIVTYLVIFRRQIKKQLN